MFLCSFFLLISFNAQYSVKRLLGMFDGPMDGGQFYVVLLHDLPISGDCVLRTFCLRTFKTKTFLRTMT